MTPDEAIRDLTEEREWLKSCDQDDKPPFVAIQLGIEALERQKQLREQVKGLVPTPIVNWIRELLPSETES